MAVMSKRATEVVLKITQDLYKEWEHKIMKRVFVHQELLDMVNLGIKDPNKVLELDETRLKDLQNYKTYLESEKSNPSKWEDVPDWEVAKEYEAELDKRLEEAIQKGELPKYTLTIIKKKTRKYARKLKGDSKETSGEAKDAA
jgi:hypothetical protein